MEHTILAPTQPKFLLKEGVQASFSPGRGEVEGIHVTIFSWWWISGEPWCGHLTCVDATPAGQRRKSQYKRFNSNRTYLLTYCHWHSFFVMLNLRIEIHSYNMRKKRSVKGQEPPALQKWVKMNSSCDLSGPSWTSTERNNIQNFCSLNGLRYQLLLASWSHKCVKSISSVAILLLLANRYSLTVNKPLFKVS